MFGAQSAGTGFPDPRVWRSEHLNPASLNSATRSFGGNNRPSCRQQPSLHLVKPVSFMSFICEYNRVQTPKFPKTDISGVMVLHLASWILSELEDRSVQRPGRFLDWETVARRNGVWGKGPPAQQYRDTVTSLATCWTCCVGLWLRTPVCAASDTLREMRPAIG